MVWWFSVRALGSIPGSHKKKKGRREGGREEGGREEGQTDRQLTYLKYYFGRIILRHIWMKRHR